MKIIKLFALLSAATLPFFTSCISEAERQRIAAEQAEQARIAKAAEEKRLAEEARLEKERQEQARKEVLKALALSEKQAIYERFQTEIFPSEQKLSEEERSRGRALLEAFGEEQMPTLAGLCKEARTAYLEAEANLEELAKALKAENIDLKTNDIFQAAGRNRLEKAAQYWWLRYKLTDFYSQFKIGVITSDELAAKDEEFAKQ